MVVAMLAALAVMTAMVFPAIVITSAVAAAMVFGTRTAAVMPATAIESPALTIALPAWLRIQVAGTRALPMTAGPDVVAAIPVPVTWCPVIAATWPRPDFIAQWRRRVTDDDIDPDLGRGSAWQECGSAKNQCCSGKKHALYSRFHGGLRQR